MMVITPFSNNRRLIFRELQSAGRSSAFGPRAVSLPSLLNLTQPPGAAEGSLPRASQPCQAPARPQLRAEARSQPCLQPTWPSVNSSKQIAQTGAELQLLAESHREACRHLAWYLRVASCLMACMVCCCTESCQEEKRLSGDAQPCTVVFLEVLPLLKM